MRASLLLVPFVLAGCSGPSQPQHLVEAHEARFDPVELSVPTAASVTWRIVSANHHTVTVAAPQRTMGEAVVDSGDLGPGQTFVHAFDEPGTYQVYCRYHSQGAQGHFDPREMTMVVQVT